MSMSAFTLSHSERILLALLFLVEFCWKLVRFFELKASIRRNGDDLSEMGHFARRAENSDRCKNIVGVPGIDSDA